MENTSSLLEKKENMIELTVSYGEDSDIARVKNTIKKLPWYARQGYSSSSVKLPTGLSESSTQEEIIAAVFGEYSAEEYEDFVIFIREKWDEFSVNFEELKRESSLNLRDKYTLVLTKYGMGGSYDAETGEVIVNIHGKEKERIVGIIFHEIVHTTIEPLVQKYFIKHWYKERLVDLMMNKYFPGLTKMQDIKEDIAVVDDAFIKFFPDFEAVAKAVEVGK